MVWGLNFCNDYKVEGVKSPFSKKKKKKYCISTYYHNHPPPPSSLSPTTSRKVTFNGMAF